MVTRAGLPAIILALFIALILVMAGLFMESGWSYLCYLIALALPGFVIFFFRDPERNIPQDRDDVLLAPADGIVLSIQQSEEPVYIQGNTRCISIFLSLMNVHVNRNPVSGTVEYVHYYPGTYHVAWHEKASSENERAEFGVKHPSGIKVFYKQITGMLARRIVYNTREQQNIKAGERFGVMKFGSRMDIFVPEDINLTVSEGDRTKAGETVIARIDS